MSLCLTTPAPLREVTHIVMSYFCCVINCELFAFRTGWNCFFALSHTFGGLNVGKDDKTFISQGKVPIYCRHKKLKKEPINASRLCLISCFSIKKE